MEEELMIQVVTGCLSFLIICIALCTGILKGSGKCKGCDNEVGIDDEGGCGGDFDVD